MVAKPKTEDQETQEDISTLLQRIETFLNAPPAPESRMTPEAQAALAAPLDPAFIKQRKGDNGKWYSYADLDYLEGRAREVDPKWSSHISYGGPNVLLMDITILGVTHSASAGYYIGDTYEVWDQNKGGYVSRPMTSRVAHTTTGAAEAAAERRCFAKFRLGEELWKKDQENQADAPAGKQQARASNSGGEFRAPTQARINFLGDLGVPESVAKRINSWSTGKDEKGQPMSDVSTVINALLQARGRDKGPVGQKVWERIVKEHAAYALSASAGNSDNGDDFDDDDF